MNIEEFRNYCLSFAGAGEKMPWVEPAYASLLVFMVGDKWFGLVDVDEFDFCNLKCDPARSLELQARYEGITLGWHMNKKYWISVYFNKDVPDSLIKELVKDSYGIVFSKLPKKFKADISAR